MSNTYVTSNPTVLEGYQSIFEANKFGKCTLQAIIDDEHIDALNDERPELLNWAKSKAKSKRVNTRLEPWEEVATGKFKVRFSWNPEQPIPIVDAEGTPIKDSIPLYSGSMVKLAFVQKPYAMPDSIGTLLRLKAIQVIKLNDNAGGSDMGSLTDETAAALFGSSEGFSISDPNVKFEKKEVDEDF